MEKPDNLEYWLKHKCTTNGCFYTCVSGYIVCGRCLGYGTQRLPDDVIDYIVKNKLNSKAN